jgi:outer membrane protein assembly factor BamB
LFFEEKGGGDIMVTKKDLIIAVLATFCLTATLFIILPSRSAEPYNPWGDVSGPTIGEPDGTINMRDINYEILRFNTFGDTAKNVTIAGHANKLAYSIENQLVPYEAIFATPKIPVDGYSKMTVCIYSSTGTNEYDLLAQHPGGARYFQMDLVINFTNSLVKTYDVPNQEIFIMYFNNEIGITSMLSIDVYLIA